MEDDSRVVCARCGIDLGDAADDADSKVQDAAHAPDSDTDRPRVDDHLDEVEEWDLARDLRVAQQTVRALKSNYPAEVTETTEARTIRIDTASLAQPQPAPPNSIVTTDSPSDRRTTKPRPTVERQPSWLPWSLICLGMMAFTFGAVLVGWSLASQRSDLWNIGMPTFLGGQAVLLLGLIFQLEGLWSTHRKTHHALDELDDRMSDLKRTTTLMTTAYSTPSQSFYTHMAEGATPQMLLTDLKGQLDLLALKMAKDERI